MNCGKDQERSGKNSGSSASRTVNEIEKAVYAYLKPYGFARHGRTLHRFVSEDISQVIHFQTDHAPNGKGEVLSVNLGIRIPECAECTFHPQAEKKPYYPEHECTMRSRLGTVSGKSEAQYDLSKPTEKIIACILRELEQTVLPAFDALNSREAILARRAAYPNFDTMRELLLLDECMIYGHIGELTKAKERFEQYYQSAANEYKDFIENGRKIYLKKGQRIVFMGQDVTAKKNGYVTLRGASRSHLDYLDALAKKLELR